jgi:hypothetical protein
MSEWEVKPHLMRAYKFFKKHYRDNVTYKEIGRQFGISANRAWQGARRFENHLLFSNGDAYRGFRID